MKSGYVTILFLLALAACDRRTKYRKAADEIASSAELGTGNMNTGKEHYSLYVPKGWTTEYRTEYGINYYFIDAPQTKDDPNTNINVITEYMQHLNLADYTSQSMASIKKSIPSASILTQGKISANGINGSWYSYTMAPQGIEASLVCYIFPRNGVAYSITAGTQTKDAARYRSTFDSVARSFKFID